MKYRIIREKLFFINHILHLEDGTLAKQILMEQHTYDMPGLAREVKTFLSELDLPDCFSEEIPKTKWKNMVKKATARENEKEVREATCSFKKMKNKNLQLEKFECKEYLSSLPLGKARTLFKHKYSMTENVKMNFKGDHSFSKSLWKCSVCRNQDTESHILWCPGYQDLREGLDLNIDSELCSYLQKVFQMRCQEVKK